MAQITGSSTIDWSGISLAQVDFETDLVTFVNRVDQIFTEFGNREGFLVSASPTLLVVDLFSGGRLTLGGSGFDTAPIINSFTFKTPPDGTGEVVRWTGTLDGIGDDVMTSATIRSTDFSQTFNGNIIIPSTFPPAPNYTATLTSLVVKIGSAKGIFSGNFHLTGNLVSASLTGTVTGISVVSGADTIKMTGLALSLDVLEAALASDDLATVNDLFSFVGNQLSGNDVITYTNNSAVGITLYGGAGNDTITVIGANADTLVGGTGNDTYVHAAGGVSDSFIENPDEGIDTIRAAVTLTLPDASQNIENLTLTGSGNIDGTGNTLNNVLTGNTDNNVLSGGDGNDQLKGRAGNDTLEGGIGDDVMMGGAGNDTYTVDVASDVVAEGLTAGTDKVFSASIDYTLTANVENLELTGSADINGTGNALANVITGNSGVNILTGGVGNDTYIVQNDTDSVVENFNAGIDLVQSSAASFTMGDNVEHLTLLGSTDINGTGNALNNRLTGNSGHNTLSGDAGNDTLNGGDGNDILIGGLGQDGMGGGLGNDTYRVNRGDGRDTISENDSTIVNSDTLLYGATINPLDLVLSRRANDLRLAIHGSTERVTIQNWFSTPGTAQVETIQAGNGDVLLNTQVDQLIQAMASFTQNTGLSWDQGIDQQPAQVQSILAASWQ